MHIRTCLVAIWKICLFWCSDLFLTVSSIIWATLQWPGRRSCRNLDPCSSCSSLKFLIIAPFKTSNTYPNQGKKKQVSKQKEKNTFQMSTGEIKAQVPHLLLITLDACHREQQCNTERAEVPIRCLQKCKSRFKAHSTIQEESEIISIAFRWVLTKP